MCFARVGQFQVFHSTAVLLDHLPGAVLGWRHAHHAPARAISYGASALPLAFSPNLKATWCACLTDPAGSVVVFSHNRSRPGERRSRGRRTGCAPHLDNRAPRPTAAQDPLRPSATRQGPRCGLCRFSRGSLAELPGGGARLGACPERPSRQNLESRIDPRR